MRNIFIKTESKLYLLLLLFLCSLLAKAQSSESDSSGFDFNGINDLSGVDVQAWAGNGNSSSDYAWAENGNWIDYNGSPGTGNNNYNDNNGNYNTNPSNTDSGSGGGSGGDKQTLSEIVLTKTVRPGQVHTQRIKVLRDEQNRLEIFVSQIIVNGLVIGTVTFSNPQKENGVEFYSKLTIEVYSNSPIAISSITPNTNEDRDYTKISSGSTQGVNQVVQGDINVYQSLGIIKFDVPINESEDLVITGSTTLTKVPTETKAPCIVAKELTVLANNQTYKKAVEDIKIAASDGLEHSITFGKNSSGQFITTTMVQGDKTSVAGNYNIQGAFASLHNHPNYTTHSGMDLHNIVFLNNLYPKFNNGLVLAGKEYVYAAVITDLAAAQTFVAKYLIDPKSNTPAHYPEVMRKEMTKVFNNMNSYSMESQTISKAFVLDKYNAGITFFKQNTKGEFYPLIAKEISQTNGSKIYTLIPCS